MAEVDYDRRDSLKNKPVWEHSITQMSWASGGGHGADTETVYVNGVITQIVTTISSATNDPDVTLSITDTSGNSFFSTTENDGQTVIDYAGGDFGYNQLTFADGFIVKADPDGDPGSGGLTVDVTVRGI